MIKHSAPSRLILLIIAGLFVSELITMGFIATLDSYTYLRLSIIDSTLMVLLATPLLYFFSLRPLLKVISEREAEIAQRKQTEIQLRIQTKALEAAANGVIVTDSDGKILWANQAFSRMTGYSTDDVLGKTPELFKSGVHDSVFYKELWETILSGNVWHGEVTNRRKDGALYIDEQTITPVFNSSDEIENFIAIQQDITERKQAEERLRRVNHALSVLNECNQVLVRAENESELLQLMCEILVNTGEYRMAWVGFAEQDQARSVRSVAQFGFEEGYLGLAQITWADNEHGRGPTGTAIREGCIQVNQNFLTNPRMSPWRASALKRGYQASIALPLKDDNSTFGALTIYSVSPDAFDEEEVHLLDELANDLAFGITALRVRAERNRAQEQIRKMALFPTLNPDAVLHVDASGLIEMTNPAANQMGIHVGAQLMEILPDLRELDLPTCIAAGVTQQVEREVHLGEDVLLWTVRGVPNLGLVFLYSKDITERKRAQNITQTRLRLMEFEISHTLDELLQTTLNEIEALTGSAAGFFHFLEPDQKTLRLQAWSTNTLESLCKATGGDNHYDMDQAGVWADCARQRKPVVHNDYEILADRKQLPDGHAPIIRELTVPILRNEKVVAILGVGNKLSNYTANDVETVLTLADFAWDMIERKRAETALVKSEEKFRALADWTYDWETWQDPLGNIVYTSPSCERITGFRTEDFIADPNLLMRIIHPDDRPFYEKHQQVLHNESIGPLNVEYRIIARDGSEHWIEHICRSLYGKDSRYLGRRVSNRDITERKRAEKDIKEREQKENMLTKTIHTMQMDIARDLHDTVGQNISYLRMKLVYMVEKGLLTDPDIALDIKRMSEVANESYDMIRGTLAVLQSEDASDLSHIFARYAAKIEERSTFKIDFASHGKPKPISANQMRQLFYVFREALSNIEKHSNASQVSLDLTWDEEYMTLVIFDNGRGFDSTNPHSGHYGLQFIRDRLELLNGSISIYSAIGSGADIIIQVPYE